MTTAAKPESPAGAAPRQAADPGGLRTLYGPATARALGKSLDRLDTYCRQFIELSPFVCLSSTAAGGHADVSPRGDAPGFVRVADDRTLLLPDRPGNNRLDSLTNIVENPEIGLLFLVPGFNETLRVNGRARIVRAPETLAGFAVNGRPPASALGVAVR